MTLCIAAACQDRRKARIVIGTDWKISTEFATAEIQEKLYWVNDNMPALIAGTVHRAIELRDTIGNYFDHLSRKKQALESMSLYQLTDAIKRPVAIFKRKLADEHVSLKFGIGYNEFRKAIGQNQIPSQIATETLQEISNLEFTCELILPFFAVGEPRIYKINRFGVVERCENFAAIGTGATIAESVLYQRQHESSDPLGPSTYHVFEAMKLGSIASDVGEEHTINILYPSGDPKKGMSGDRLTDPARKFLERKFKKYGPKDFTRLALPKNALEWDF